MVSRRKFAKLSAVAAGSVLTGIISPRISAVPSKTFFNTFYVYYNSVGEVTFKHKFQTLNLTPIPSAGEWHVFHLARNPDGVDIGGVVQNIQFETIDNPESGNHVIHRRVELLHMRQKPKPGELKAAMEKKITGGKKYCIKETFIRDEEAGVAEGEWISKETDICAGPSVRSGLLLSAFELSESKLDCGDGQMVDVVTAEPK